MPITLAIQNQSTVLTDAQVAPMVAAIQKQVTGDFAPIWGVDAVLSFVPQGQPLPNGAWPMFIVDDSDQAGALGDHGMKESWPIGFVFAKADVQAGLQTSVTLSHEVVEMLVDPYVFSVVVVDHGHGPLGAKGVMLAQEVADACEDDSLGYLIDGVLVSDFVTPGWFGAPGWQAFSFRGNCKQPFEILHNGYIGVRNYRGAGEWGTITAAFLGSADTGWHQLRKDGTPQPLDQIPALSRRGRRMAQWRNPGPVLATQDPDEDRET